MPFLLKSCPSISLALIARHQVGIFTERPTKTPKICVPAQNSSFRADYFVRVRTYLEFVPPPQALVRICRH